MDDKAPLLIVEVEDDPESPLWFWNRKLVAPVIAGKRLAIAKSGRAGRTLSLLRYSINT